jgi:H+/Cl- antiporter ClcA
MSSSNINNIFIRSLDYIKTRKRFFLILLPAIIGVLSGIGSFVFKKSIEFVHHHVFVGGSELLNIAQSGLTRLELPIILIAGALLLIPIFYFFPEASGYRLPYFLEKINLRGGYHHRLRRLIRPGRTDRKDRRNNRLIFRQTLQIIVGTD